jgi:hypothetical protein
MEGAPIMMMTMNNYISKNKLMFTGAGAITMQNL